MLELALWAVAALGIGWYVVAQAAGDLYQAREEVRLEELLASGARPSRPAASPAAARPTELPGDEAPRPAVSLPPGAAIGKMAVPRLGLSVMIAGGADKRTLRRAVGHIPGTALPGQRGNVGLAGHRDRYFRPLKDVREGDEITLTTPEGTFHYRVDWTEVVDPEAVHVLDDTGEATLTLVTCYPFYYVGPAPRRFIVRASQVRHEAPAAAEAGP